MKICIPVEKNDGMKSQVYGHFGSAPFFAVYDTDKNELEVIDNENSQHEHGMCNPLGSLMSKNINVVVCAGMGGRAVQRLNESGVKAYRAQAGTVEDVAEQYRKGGLEELTAENACAHHNCH